MASYDLKTYDLSDPAVAIADGVVVVPVSQQVHRITLGQFPAGTTAFLVLGGRASIPLKAVGQSWTITPPERNGIRLLVPFQQVGKLMLIVSYGGTTDAESGELDPEGTGQDELIAYSSATVAPSLLVVEPAPDQQYAGVFNPDPGTIILVQVAQITPIVVTGNNELSGNVYHDPTNTNFGSRSPMQWRDTRQPGSPKGVIQTGGAAAVIPGGLSARNVFFGTQGEFMQPTIEVALAPFFGYLFATGGSPFNWLINLLCKEVPL